MNFAWLFLNSMLYLAAVEYREANGLTVDDMDFVRSTIKSVAKSITSKPTSISGRRHTIAYSTRITSAKAPPPTFLLKSMSHLPLPPKFLKSSRFAPKSKPKPKAKAKRTARNLNKFNEAMDQVERAMVQAELSRRTAKLTDLKKDIKDAVNRGNVR
jgi:hypothetical protein